MFFTVRTDKKSSALCAHDVPFPIRFSLAVFLGLTSPHSALYSALSLFSLLPHRCFILRSISTLYLLYHYSNSTLSMLQFCSVLNSTLSTISYNNRPLYPSPRFRLTCHYTSNYNFSLIVCDAFGFTPPLRFVLSRHIISIK